ncbi:DUF2064 domain-containing protein [uncultured Psychroserpens sp.]|uniref:TIGR04282 family arsenosugar biosynthesis glycosyltransferase n=1 Tax=uncultured Psychroserpens sp. TaxID=255436 RepID=UPI0026321FAF|nr:DUF2064 domain-containing protein [uncultured Psychroserpens sp.]
MNSKTAILIFANSAHFEAKQKPFRYSETLFESLNTQTLKIVEQTGLPYFHYSEKNQIGTTFGRRFTNAIQSIYDKGFETIITIGNDTPHLKTEHINKAEKQLELNDIVLGPSNDGGFYLMGLKKSCFDMSSFLELPWQTSRLNSCINRLLTIQNIKFSYLEVLSDIDTFSDVKFIINSFKGLSRSIKQFLLVFLSIKKEIIKPLLLIIEIKIQTKLFNKGSPFKLA